MQEQIICNKEDLIAIADAVRASTGSTETYNVPELSIAAVEAIGSSGSSLELDTTLKVAGKAADAGAVGDALNELEKANETRDDEISKRAKDADLAAVAKSGSYNDLKNTPTIPTVPKKLPNPYPLTINGQTYDGSTAVDVSITTDEPEDTEKQTKIYVTPLEFGAVGDGVTDDSDAIQAALNNADGYDVYFPPGHNFAVEKTLVISKSHIKLIGHSDNFQSNPKAGRTETIISKCSPVFHITVHSITFDGVSFINQDGKEQDDTDLADCIVNEAITGGETVLNVRNCHFKGYKNAIIFKGRNVNVRDNLFFNCVHAVRVEYTYEGDSDTPESQKPSNGLRGIRIVNNRFHSFWGHAIHVAAGIPVGMQIVGNYMDVQGGLLKADTAMDGTIIAKNSVLFPSVTPIELGTFEDSGDPITYKNLVINGNVIKGAIKINYSDSAIKVEKLISTCIADNVFSTFRGSAIVVTGDCTSVNVTGNTFRQHCFDEEGGGPCISFGGKVKIFSATGNTVWPANDVRVFDHFIGTNDGAKLQYVQVVGNALMVSNTLLGGELTTTCNIQTIAGYEVS